MEFIIIGGVLITAVLIVLMTSVRLKVRQHTVNTRKVTKPLRAVHISDLHESLYGDGQRALLQRVTEAKPDIILITGDIIEDDDADPAEKKVLTLDNPARMLLEKLPRIAPSYMVFGNHESNIPNTDMLCAEVEELGIRVLHRRNPDDDDMHEAELIAGCEVRICGADDPYFDRREPQKKHRSMSERVAEDREACTYDKEIWRERVAREYGFIGADTTLTLLLSHRPEEFSLYEKLGFDAAFSGHAHGGQWRLPPFINGLYAPHQGFFPKHAGGVYICGRMHHVVSRGLSKKRFVRIFNRPEIWVVDFEPDT